MSAHTMSTKKILNNEHDTKIRHNDVQLANKEKKKKDKVEKYLMTVLSHRLPQET